ncbi:methyltransferase domain-containing protein [Kitasatospora purpeofusca]|uniref:methyltransferase domain-containing protein n=1 Tax=Kitasatospora purpeofusca TaxID=67352 RepID=UPI00225003CF|nr:methyltransferase domain-containing protein [Kitasatospora purpeofusca]MCX4685929.1 methyltransferase domain-containing protein [Kitasatospora purpeofusca]
MIAGLTMSGTLEAAWRGAFERAPRHAFVPDTVWLPDEHSLSGYRQVERSREPDAWWDAVSADEAVVTQLDDGMSGGPGTSTSSGSMPSLVATMLRELAVQDGHRVLDVGTGTGWTSALLAARLGGEQVTTIEIDPVLAADAGRKLEAAHLAPCRVVGDGLAGWSPGAPYDRIHSTAAVRWIPPEWIEQTVPDGIVVTPWGTPYANAGLLRLVVEGPGQEAHGRFVENASFMWMRAQRPHVVAAPAMGTTRTGASPMDPKLAEEDVHAAFAIGLRVPGVRSIHCWDRTDPAATYRIELSDGHGSWASVRYRNWGDEGAMKQTGPRRLWDEVCEARTWWVERGRPELTRFGLTVRPDGRQQTWLDSPAHPVGDIAH